MNIFKLAWVGIFFCLITGFSPESQETYQRAYQMFQSGDYDQAIELLQKIIEDTEDVKQAEIYNLLGLVYLKQNTSIASAIGSFEQAVRIAPEYAEAYFNLASAYAGPANNSALAAVYFQKTIDADPDFARAYFGLGWFSLISQHDAAKAEEYFLKTIQKFPDFSEAYYGLGLAKVQMGKNPLALEYVTKLRELNRNDLAAYLETAIRGGDAVGSLPEEETSPQNQSEVSESGTISEQPAQSEIPRASDFLDAPSQGDWDLSGD